LVLSNLDNSSKNKFVMKKHFKVAAKYYHKYNRPESLYSRAFKHFLLWFFIFFMAIITFFLFKKNDIRIPQKTVSIAVEIKDKINICLPDEKK